MINLYILRNNKDNYNILRILHSVLMSTTMRSEEEEMFEESEEGGSFEFFDTFEYYLEDLDEKVPICEVELFNSMSPKKKFDVDYFSEYIDYNYGNYGGGGGNDKDDDKDTKKRKRKDSRKNVLKEEGETFQQTKRSIKKKRQCC
jgi:hypothetical protein